MKNPEPPQTTEHPSDLLLPYVEGSLSAADRHMVEEHVRGCPLCSEEVEGIRETVGLLGHHKEIFCPEPWELYEYVRYGNDPEEAVAKHLERCGECREALQSLAADAPWETMPAPLWQQVREHVQPEPERVPVEDLSTEPFLHRIYRWFRFPAVAAGVAAVALLAVVLLRSPGMPQSVIALSSVGWEVAARPKTTQPPSGRLAIALVLKGFDPPLSQTKVDALYQALAPTMDVAERFALIPPAALEAAMDTQGRKMTDTRQILQRLGKKLELSKALVITITSQAGGARVDADLLDTLSGEVKAHKTEENVTASDLEGKIREAARSLLLGSGT